MVMARVLWPSRAAIASRLMPRLIAWIARVWRSWWAVTCPIPASWDSRLNAVATRSAVMGRLRSSRSRSDRSPVVRRLAIQSSSISFSCGCSGVVEEPRQGFVDDGKVPSEDERALRGVGVAPLGDPVEEAVQVDEPVLDADAVQRLAGVAAVLGREPGLVALDVVALEVRAAAHVGVGLGEPGAELAQVVLDVLDR